MAPTGRGGLRPYQPSKFQQFIIICLIVTVVVFGFNFWNLMKKNSLLLVELGKLQTNFRKLELERKDCSIQLVSVEEKRKIHETGDREKEILLEDTRREVEDLKAEAELLRQNITKLQNEVIRAELSANMKENRSRSGYEQRFEEAKLQLESYCSEEKVKLQKEMTEQMNVMKKQLKMQYQETEELDQMLQQRQQHAVEKSTGERQPLGNGQQQLQQQLQQHKQQGSELKALSQQPVDQQNQQHDQNLQQQNRWPDSQLQERVQLNRTYRYDQTKFGQIQQQSTGLGENRQLEEQPEKQELHNLKQEQSQERVAQSQTGYVADTQFAKKEPQEQNQRENHVWPQKVDRRQSNRKWRLPGQHPEIKQKPSMEENLHQDQLQHLIQQSDQNLKDVETGKQRELPEKDGANPNQVRWNGRLQRKRDSAGTGLSVMMPRVPGGGYRHQPRGDGNAAQVNNGDRFIEKMERPVSVIPLEKSNQGQRRDEEQQEKKLVVEGERPLHHTMSIETEKPPEGNVEEDHVEG